MMILDRYLLRQFLQVFVICFCSLTGLYIVIDGFGNLDEFMTYSKENGSLLKVMSEYYGYRSLTFFDRTSGVLTLIAAMFTVTWIQRHQELTALLAAGVSKRRVVKPVIIAVAIIGALAVLNRELIIPSVRQKLSYNAQDLSGTQGHKLAPKWDNKTDINLGGAQTFADKQRIVKPSFLLPRTLQTYGKKIIGDMAYYMPTDGDRPGGYLITGVKLPANLDRQPSLTLADERIVLTPADTSWLQSGECFVVSDVTFEQLSNSSTWRSLASTLDLIQGLRNPSLDFGADVRVAIHARIVQPLLDMTLLFLGLPLVLSTGNRNMFLAIGLCLGVVMAFMGTVLGCQQLASTMYLSAALAAWLPLILFAPVASYMAEPLLE